MAFDSGFSPVVIWSPIVQGLVNNMRHTRRMQNRNGPTGTSISIHPDLCQSVRGHTVPADKDQTRAVLELMGGHTSDICNLANADAISCVMHVFFRAVSSPERKRGLFVVWNSIRVLTQLCQDPSREISYPAIAGKNHIGDVYFKQLVEMMGFSNGRNRRMAAEILLELIRKCPGQLTILASKTSRDLRVLGKMVLTGSDHLQAFMYGSIIKEMVPYSMGFLLWPEDSSKEDIDRFPKTVILSSAWIEMFVRLRRRKGAPGRDRIMLIGAAEIENETWVTQCGIPVVMTFSEFNSSNEQGIVFVTFQAGEVAYLRVPCQAVAKVRVLQDDNKVELLLTDDGYYTSKHEQRKKKVKVIMLTPHPLATAKDVAEGVRTVLLHRPGVNNHSYPPSLGFPTSGGGAGAFNPTNSTIFGATPGTDVGMPGSRRFGMYDGPCDDDYLTASNTTGQAQVWLTLGGASAAIELPTGEQVEIETANYFKVTQEPRTEVPDSQIPDSHTQSVTRAAPLEHAMSDASSNPSSEEEYILETISQEDHVANTAHFGDMEIDLGIAVDMNDDDMNDNDMNSDFDNNTARDAPSADFVTVAEPQGQNESGLASETDHNAEPKALEEKQADDHSELEDNQKGAERQVQVLRPSNPDKSTRLRRPTRKILRPPPPLKAGSVDWSQDIRVDPEELRDNLLSKSTKKARKPMFRQLRDVKVSTLKARVNGKKATTPNDKSRRKALKTVASTRVQRAAAEKAKEKIALAVSSEDESVAFDPEDPIETSSAAKPDVQANPVEDTELPDDDASDSDPIGDENVTEDVATVDDGERPTKIDCKRLSAVANPESDNNPDLSDHAANEPGAIGDTKSPEAIDGEHDIDSEKLNSVARHESRAHSINDTDRLDDANMSEDIGEEYVSTKISTVGDGGREDDSEKSKPSDDINEGPQIDSPSIADSGVFIDKNSVINEDNQEDQVDENIFFSENEQGGEGDVECSTTYACSRSTPERITSSSEPETPCPKSRKRSRSVTEAPAKESPSMAWKKALRESQKTTLDILMDTSHRVVKSMVNEERAVEMVVLTYKNGLARVKEQMLEAHEGNLVYVRSILDGIKTGIAGECREILATLKDDQQDLGPFPEVAREDNVLEEIAAAMEEYKRM